MEMQSEYKFYPQEIAFVYALSTSIQVLIVQVFKV